MATAPQSAAGVPLDRPAPAALDLDAGTTVLARLHIYGIPKPQGSKVAFLDRHTGRPASRSRTPAAPGVADDVVAAAARARRAPDAPLDGALALEVTFRFPMPKARPKVSGSPGWCSR